MTTSPRQSRNGERSSWHLMSAEDVADHLGVNPGKGLSTEEARRRCAENGPNVLPEEARRPRWRRLVTLLLEPMTVVLLVAALVSAVASVELATPIAIVVVVVFNATLNLVQERRAESSVDALRRMTVARARVRRDGRLQQVDAAELVPGDLVLLEAGDMVPADGRVLRETGPEVEEASLTGGAAAVAKDAAVLPPAAAGAALGDRVDMVFMGTEVTRGSGAFIVTGTGMHTEIGRVAGMLQTAGDEETPLQRRIGQLARMLSAVAGVVVVIVVTLGLIRGLPFSELLLTGVSLAVATIPEGLTAVVAFTLAMGAGRLASHGAILKDLSSVETLGSTSRIATDKTGTLTLNQMTARRLFAVGHPFTATGEGYRTDGTLEIDDDTAPVPTAALLAMALASDAEARDGDLVGDPTEGALVVLAEKGGLDVTDARRRWPRVAEIPFDSSRKYMATLHRLADSEPSPQEELAAPPYRSDDATVLFVKGAPDVLAARSDSVLTAAGPVELDLPVLERLREINADLASEGMRVMAVGARGFTDAELDVKAVAHLEPEEMDAQVTGLTLLAFVGIVDPPRPEAMGAVAEAQAAGITVHMITGDHVATASAIARQLGIGGDAILGTEVDEIDDAELASRARHLGVLARVSPEHKIRMVDALRADGSVVAMTGDGVNDAPALKQADIGIAMGIAGTDVSKGAARMILTDDNFATIVAAVREGRGIYDNIIKFIRFQVATAWGFVLVFLVASLFDIAGGTPFTALQILWVNIIMDGPPAMALGLDDPAPDVMRRRPRPVHEPILTAERLLRILLAAAVMAGGTLGILVLAPGANAMDVATLGFTTYVLFQVFNLLNVRSAETSVFSLRTLTNRWLWAAIGAVVLLQGAVVHLPTLQQLFDTSALSVEQWLLAATVASSVIWIEELRKAIMRRRHAVT
jgi:Ca2+-transporting ATPase